MDERLVDLARARGGLLTVPEAARLGATPGRLNRFRTQGLLVHLRRGAYALADTWDAATGSERYALRVRAVLRTRPAVAASHHAALALAGVPAWGPALDRVDVVELTGTCTRVRSKRGVVVRPWPAASEIVTDSFGDPRVPAVVALVQMARDCSALAFAAALDQALRLGLTSTGEVAEALQREGRGHRWVRQGTDLLAGADPLSPCPEATRLRVLLTDMGFRPRLRVPLWCGARASVTRAELLLGSSIAVSRTAYTGRELARLRELGVAVALIGDDDLDHPDRVAASIAGAMGELDALRSARARGA